MNTEGCYILSSYIIYSLMNVTGNCFSSVHNDSMTDGAQQALRRTMEIYSKTTRFALACNTSDKIIGECMYHAFLKRFNLQH